MDFSLLIANFELLSMEIFCASRERFFSFVVFVAVLIFGFEQIIFSFTVSCTDILRLIDISRNINLPSVLFELIYPMPMFIE